MIGLCLLVYSLDKRQPRQNLTRTKSTIKNQLDRPTYRPTLRWIFQCFQSIHLLINYGVNSISNLTPERLELLKFFSPSCQRYYLLS